MNACAGQLGGGLNDREAVKTHTEICYMEYALLGPSGLRVSRISFGCMSLGTDEKTAEKLILRAIDAGINLFDTADLYDRGHNERMIGRILKGRRDAVVLATKVGNQWRADGSGWDWNPRPEYILRAVEDSLQRLDTDYIDLYQLHGGTIQDPIGDCIGVFELLKQQGKIRHYGISSIRPEVIREYVNRSGITSVMMQYSLLDRRPEESCLPLLQEAGIGVLARGALAKGLLAGKPAAEFLNYGPGEVGLAAAAIAACSGPARTAAQTALRFVLGKEGITSAVTGIRTMEQLEEVIGTLHSPELSAPERELLEGALPPNLYTQYR